jgi:hypothetical protein
VPTSVAAGYSTPTWMGSGGPFADADEHGSRLAGWSAAELKTGPPY